MKSRLLSVLFSTLITFSALNAHAQRIFNHPGGILSSSDLERIRTHVNAGDEPWASCWKSLQQDNASKSTYTAAPSSEIGGSNGTRQRAAADAYAAMINAVEWHVTGNEAYAQCAARILTAWGNALESANDELFQYPCRAMIAAAEMLRNSDGTFYEGWKADDRDLFLSKVRNVMVPAGRKFCSYYNTHPSWFTPAALVVLGAGVLLDDEAIYDEGYKLMLDKSHWGTMYGGSIEPGGQMREMGRDNVHGGLTLGDITQACLFAWNQGDDLFAEGDDRLLKGMEYWCRYNTGHTDVPYAPLDCSGLDNATGYSFYYISTHNNGFRLRPDACSFEAVYHHYKEVKKLDEATYYPYLGMASKLARPDTNNQMLGYGTLFFTIDPSCSAFMTDKPARPAGTKAESAYRYVNVTWDHPQKEDVRGFRILRSTNGKTFTLLDTRDYYTNNEYKDENVECGTTYYYKVQFINQAGYSEMSDIVSATPQAGTEALPQGWRYYGVNSVAFGSGRYTEAQDSTFAVEGVGADIGGTTDTHGFIYRKVTGDATLTTRLTSIGGSSYKVGILMRGTLSGNSQRVGITMGEKGNRMLRMCCRTTAGGNTSWVNGTNYAYTPLWLRLSRLGNTFTGYISRDSLTWIEVGSFSATLPSTYYIGMAACTGANEGSTGQAVFDHVSFHGTDATPARKPSVPNGLDAQWAGSNEAYISWYPVQDADSFTVYRSTDGEAYDSVATVRETHYTDLLPQAGTYYYKVSATNAIGTSKLSPGKAVYVDKIVILKGTVIGTSGSWNNNSATTRDAAFDNNINTYFDAKESSGAWVGIDLGENTKSVITHITFAPRKGFASRMVGGTFQVADNPDFNDAETIATINAAPADGSFTTISAKKAAAYRYIRYLSPAQSNGNVAELQFYGTVIEDTPSAIQHVWSQHTNTHHYNINGTLSDSALSNNICIYPDGRKILNQK